MNKELFQKWWKQYLEKQFGCKLWNDDGSCAASYTVDKELLEHKRTGLSAFNFLNKEVVAQEWQSIENYKNPEKLCLFYYPATETQPERFAIDCGFFYSFSKPTHFKELTAPVTKEKED